MDRRWFTFELSSPVSTEAVGTKHYRDLVAVQQFHPGGLVMPYLVPNSTKVPCVVLAWRLRTELDLPIWVQESEVSTAVQGKP